MTGRTGAIYVPKEKDGKWIYDDRTWKITVSNKSPKTKDVGQHLNTLTKKQQEVVLKYIHEKGHKIGKSKIIEVSQNHELKDNERWFEKKPTDETKKRKLEIIEEKGLSNTYQLRDEINIKYFLDLEKSIPEWPWPFKIKRKGFQL